MPDQRGTGCSWSGLRSGYRCPAQADAPFCGSSSCTRTASSQFSAATVASLSYLDNAYVDANNLGGKQS